MSTNYKHGRPSAYVRALSLVRDGTCDTMDPLVPIYPLADVDADGKSVTTVPNITLADIATDPFVITVHDSLAEFLVIVSCGNMPVAGGGDDEATPVAGGVGGGAPEDIPTTDVGSAIGLEDRSSAVLIALGVLAVVLTVAGISPRRLEDRANTGRDTAI